MVGHSHLPKNFPQFVVIHIVTGLSVDSEAEVDAFFLEFLCFMIQQILVILSLVPLPFLNAACTYGNP